MSISKLYKDLRQGEALFIGGARVVLEHKSGQAVRLCIEAPRDMVITRENTKNPSAQECVSSHLKEHTNG